MQKHKFEIILIFICVLSLIFAVGIGIASEKEASHRDCITTAQILKVPYDWNFRWECQLKINDTWFYSLGLKPGPGPTQ